MSSAETWGEVDHHAACGDRSPLEAFDGVRHEGRGRLQPLKLVVRSLVTAAVRRRVTPNVWRASDASGTIVRTILAWTSVAIVGLGLGGALSVLSGDIPLGVLRVLLGYGALLAVLPLGFAVVVGAIEVGHLLRDSRASTG